MRGLALATITLGLSVLCTAAPALGQVTNTGTIQTIVQDQSNLAVPGADVTAESADGVTKRSGVAPQRQRVGDRAVSRRAGAPLPSSWFNPNVAHRTLSSDRL